MTEFPPNPMLGELFYPPEGNSRTPVLYAFSGHDWVLVPPRTAVGYWRRREGNPELTLAEYDVIVGQAE